MELELQIDRLGINGEGVASCDGLKIFVDGALPGERVVVKIIEKRKNFCRGRVIKTLGVSPDRIEPICPLFGRCGGCQIMHLKYEMQLEAKRQRVIDALERIGGFSDLAVNSCVPSPLPLYYRNKIQLPVSPMGHLGLYARNSHDIVEIEKCYIHCDLGEKVFQVIRKLKHIQCKHVLIKTAVKTGQVLVVLVSDDKIDDSIGKKLMEMCPEIKGVVHNLNKSSGNAVLSSDFRKLAGQGWIEEELHGLKFKISPASFFQVNPAQAEHLYDKVAEFAALEGDETVLDAYCGVGTLALILSSKAKLVIGIESVKAAIVDAGENAKLNQITNVHFKCGPAEDLIATLKNVDVAILNPPRKGCEGSFLGKLIILKPKTIVYVSCDPATLARDLAILASKGYAIQEVQPFDMFPQTSHVECVVKLTSSS